MTVPQKGQADHLELGSWNAICSVCGRKYKASEMVKQPDGVGTPWGGGTYVCKRDYRPRQPQDFVRGIPDKMAPPWVQPWPDTGQFQRMPVINITEDTEEQIVFVNVGSPSSVGVRLVIVVAPNVTLSKLTLDEVTTTGSDVYFAEEVIVNNSGIITSVDNPDSIPLTVNNFGGATFTGALQFTVQPTETNLNQAISPAVEVTLKDGLGDTITSFTGNITVALGSNPGSGALGGTLTKAAVAGVATFDDLTLDQPGIGYTLVATASDTLPIVSATSDGFDVVEVWVLVAGAAGAQRGYKQDTGLGSLTPNTFNGAEIVFLESRVVAVTNTGLWTNGAQPQDFFTSITIDGVTLLSADATYTGATWTWTGTVLIPAVGTYDVTFT